MIRSRAIAVALVVLVVAVCAWPLVAFSMKHYLPEIDNDELMYFLLVKTFRSQGLHNGYSFTNDQIPAGAIHFNIQGPGIVPLYGELARVVGWTNYSPYLANLLMFIPSWLLFAYALRRHSRRQIAASLFVLANGYFFIFLPSAMQESFHLSAAIAMAALWLIALERESLTAWAALLVLTTVAILVRYSWAVVLPCVLFSFLMEQTRTWPMRRRIVVSGLVSIVVTAIVVNIAVRLLIGWALPPASAPKTAFGLPQLAFGLHVANIVINLKAIAHLKSIGQVADYPRYFLAGVIVMLAVFLAVAVLASGSSRTRSAGAAGFVMLAAALSAQVLFYTIDGWRDFRVLLPVHALAGLMFFSQVDVPSDRWTLATRAGVAAALLLLIAGNAMLSVKGLQRAYGSNWTGNIIQVDIAGRNVFTRLASYFEVRDSDSAFCKTVYANGSLWGDARLAYMPGAFAVSAIAEDAPGRLPSLRGKYALIKRESPTFDWEGALQKTGQWRKVIDVSDLTLYRSTVNCLSST